MYVCVLTFTTYWALNELNQHSALPVVILGLNYVLLYCYLMLYEQPKEQINQKQFRPVLIVGK